MRIGDEHGFFAQGPQAGLGVKRGDEIGFLQKSIPLELGQDLLGCAVCGGHAWLGRFQPRRRLLYGRHEALCHSPGQPEPELLTVLGVESQHEAVLPLVMMDRYLVNVHLFDSRQTETVVQS